MTKPKRKPIQTGPVTPGRLISPMAGLYVPPTQNIRAGAGQLKNAPIENPMNKITKLKTINASCLYVVDEPFEEARSAPPSKYEEVFMQMEANKRLVCAPDEAPKLKSALEKWMMRRGVKDPVCRARSRCKDGNGGVWWLKEAA